MTATDEIIPGFKLPERELIRYAKDQPEYLEFPMWNGPDGLRIGRFKLSFLERIQILLTGSIWIRMLTFNNPLQPIKLELTCPLTGSILDEEI